GEDVEAAGSKKTEQRTGHCANHCSARAGAEVETKTEEEQSPVSQPVNGRMARNPRGPDEITQSAHRRRHQRPADGVAYVAPHKGRQTRKTIRLNGATTAAVASAVR